MHTSPRPPPLHPFSRRDALCAAAGVLLLGPGSARAAACSTLLDRSFPRLQDEKPQSLCQYSGQVLLVVNTASFCGFTPQYRSLEALHARYRERGFAVLGFPSNDFGAQEPGSDKQIADFCENTFGVRFPMFTKSHVVTKGGEAPNPLFAELTRLTGQPPRWNFHKYLIARDGRNVSSYPSDLDPLDKSFVAIVEKLVGAQ